MNFFSYQSKNFSKKNRSAFSLMELLIVIMIIGVVYTLAIGKFQDLGEKKVAINLQNLKEYLKIYPKLSGVDTFEKVRFLCLDNCRSCDILVDGRKVGNTSSFDNFLDTSIKIYRYDYLQGLNEVSQKVYFNTEGIEETVCFSYEIDNNGVGDQVIIEYKDRVYDYTNYLGKTKVYKSVRQFKEEKDQIIEEVIR